MKFNQHKHLIPLAICGLFFVAGNLFASPPGGPMGLRQGEDGPRMEKHMKGIEKKLNLSAEQQKKLDENRKAHRQEIQALKKEMRAKREALRAELDKPDFSADKAKALNEEMKVLENKMADHRLKGILEVRGILTPEQFKKFQDLAHKRWEGKKGDWRKNKMDGEGPGARDRKRIHREE